MNKKDFLKRLETEEDFICIKRFDFSLKSLQQRYPNGCPDRIIAQALNMTEEQLQEFEQILLQKLKNALL